jgi:hypothetical protein
MLPQWQKIKFKANGMRLPAARMEGEIMLVMMEGNVEEDGVLDAREGESAQGSFGGETENPLSGREWIQTHWSEVASCLKGRRNDACDEGSAGGGGWVVESKEMG